MMNKEEAIQLAFDESATEHHDWFRVDTAKFLEWLAANGLVLCRMPGGVHSGRCPTCGCEPLHGQDD